MDTANERELIYLVTIMQTFIAIDAVIPGCKYVVSLAMKLSNDLNLPSVSPHTIMPLKRKDLMYQKLALCQIPTPAFHVINSISELEHALTTIGFPVVCKPIDSVGRVHMRQVNNVAEAYAAANRIFTGKDVLWNFPFMQNVLVQEYIKGNAYSMEGIIKNKNIMFFSMTEKIFSDQSEFIEIGHIVNPPMDIKLRKRIQNYIEQVIVALEMNYCPFQVKIKINQYGEPLLMGVVARLAEDKIGDLVNLSRGINYYDHVYAAYLGEDLPSQQMDNVMAGIRFFYRPDVNRYSHISGIDAINKYAIEEINFYYQSNLPIPFFSQSLRRLGHVIATSDDYANLFHLLADIDERIVFHA